MAASATFALKAGVWFRRARLLIVSPDSRVNLARRQAETPLIPLFRFLRPALGSEFLTALRMLAGREVMVKKLTDFKARHKAKQSESIAVLLARAAEGGDQEAISLLAAGALEMRV
jgi:hypothetical protein